MGAAWFVSKFDSLGNFAHHLRDNRLNNPRYIARADLIGNELKATRATYEEYLVGKKEFLEEMRAGGGYAKALKGHHVGRITTLTVYAATGFLLGELLGRNKFEPYKRATRHTACPSPSRSCPRCGCARLIIIIIRGSILKGLVSEWPRCEGREPRLGTPLCIASPSSPREMLADCLEFYFLLPHFDEPFDDIVL